MKFYSLFCAVFQFCIGTSVKIKPNLQRNILNFGYGINYNYEGMLAHSFDRFYGVTKFMLPRIGDLKFSKLNFDGTCAYTENKYAQNTESRKYVLELKAFCNKVKPFVTYYDKLINSYTNTAHNILEKEIKLLLPEVKRKKKCGIITTLVSNFIGWLMKVYLVSFSINEIMLYKRLLMLWMIKLIFSIIN